MLTLNSTSSHMSAGLVSPFFFKDAVDKLVEGGVVSIASNIMPCIYGLLLYGGLRMLSQVAKELQMPLFTPVSQVWPGSHQPHSDAAEPAESLEISPVTNTGDLCLG